VVAVSPKPGRSGNDVRPALRIALGPAPSLSGSGYRTRLEILRDVLVFARHGISKSRIMSLANLSPRSLQSYLSMSVASGLLAREGRRYRSTPVAQDLTEAIERVLSHAGELSLAIDHLQRLTSMNFGDAIDFGDLSDVARRLVGVEAQLRLRSRVPLPGAGTVTPTMPRAWE
jgi:predicted transcriptional regulator